MEIEELSSIGLYVFATKDEEKENLCIGEIETFYNAFQKCHVGLHASINRRDPEKRSHVKGMESSENSHFYFVFFVFFSLLCFISRTWFYIRCMNLSHALEIQKIRTRSFNRYEKAEREVQNREERKPTS